MIVRLLSLLPDPLKWLDDALAILRHGPGHKLEWVAGSAWHGKQVEGLLNRYGIRTYWRDYGHSKRTKGVHVPRQQAAWADWLLRRAGCPLVSPPLSRSAPGPMPTDWGAPARPVGMAGAITRLLSPLRRRPQR